LNWAELVEKHAFCNDLDHCLDGEQAGESGLSNPEEALKLALRVIQGIVRNQGETADTNEHEDHIFEYLTRMLLLTISRLIFGFVHELTYIRWDSHTANKAK